MKSQTDYMPDLTNLQLDEYKRELKTGRILPSRKPLLIDIDGKFSLIQKAGFHNAGSLKDELKNGKLLSRLAKETGISEDYLKLLKREMNGLLPTPIKFDSIPGISEEMVEQLNELGVIDTEDLYPYVRDPEARQKFQILSGFSMEEVLWLTKLVDVSRIKWVGPKLAGLIVKSEFDTVEKLSDANPEKVLHALNKAKLKEDVYQGALGIDDIESWIQQVVVKTPLVIKY